MDSTDHKTAETASETTPALQPKRPYEAPRVEKKRSVARATLFSGGGVSAVGLTAEG